MSKSLHSIVEETRSLHQQFENEVQPYTDDLWKYCRYVTGSPWEGEDLFQDTLLKAFAMLPQMWRPVNTKAYLFRIATNRWIDECRRKTEHLHDEEPAGAVSEQTDPIEISNALEHLVLHLNPKQVSTVLLMDVFRFKASEVATMIHSTEGAVHATLYRARMKLKSTNGREERMPVTSSNDAEVIDRYIQAFNARDVDALVGLMSETIHNEASPGFQEFSKEDTKKGSLEAGIMGKKIFREDLWGKSVLIVLAETSEGMVLHDVQYQEVSDEKIVRHKSFFFCKQLLTEVASVIGVPLQLKKGPVNWEA